MNLSEAAINTAKTLFGRTALLNLCQYYIMEIPDT